MSIIFTKAQVRSAAGALAVFYAGVPEDAMTAELYRTEAALENELRASLGADAASTIAEDFVVTIIRCWREIEAGGSMPRVVN